jgi:ubiquinone/menaquinone biosynthesis C-methylase UbiE
MVNREFSIAVNWFLDNICPPVLRDCRWFMFPIIYAAYGSKAGLIMDFKEKMTFLSSKEMAEYYDLIKDVPIARRPVDANKLSIKYILDNLTLGQDGARRILDAACGRGYILNKILDKYPNAECTSVDYNNSKNMRYNTIKDHKKALDELLRVTKSKLIISVPRQREYWYTIDLHIHFIPYLYSFKQFIGIENNTGVYGFKGRFHASYLPPPPQYSYGMES